MNVQNLAPKWGWGPDQGPFHKMLVPGTLVWGPYNYRPAFIYHSYYYILYNYTNFYSLDVYNYVYRTMGQMHEYMGI